MYFFEEGDRNYESYVVNEDVYVGELVAVNSNKYELFNANDHTIDQWRGVAEEMYGGQQIVDDPRAGGGRTFKSSEDDRASAGGYNDGDVIRTWTVKDDGDDTTPSISVNDVVGVVDTSDADLSASAFDGRVVQEGYTDEGDSTSTTYNRSNGNFIPIGVAHKKQLVGETPLGFDTIVRVEVKKDVLQ